MNNHQQVLKYADLFLRWKKIIIFCLLISIAAGLVIYLRTQKVYESTALIMFQQQRINPSKMSPDPSGEGMEMTMYNLSQQITGRSGLEEIIEKFDLYPTMRKRFPMEVVVGRMQKNNIKIFPTRRGSNFKVSFSGTEPQKVMQVTNELAAKFIEGNLKDREERASETSAYTTDELLLAKERLDKKEQLMRDYKLQYYNQMPQQLGANMSRLNLLQNQYQNNQNNTQQLEQTKILLQEQIALRDKLAMQENVFLGHMSEKENLAGINETTPEMIARLSRELEQLKLQYTEKHPAVKTIIRQLEALQNPQNETQQAAGLAEDQGLPGNQNLIDPQLEQLKRQLTETEFRIQSLKDEKEKLSKQIEKYQQWVEAVPIREAEWASLTRDYSQLDKNYQELVRRNLQAEAAESIERQQKGSRFKIVEAARFPEKPIKPNFVIIMLGAVALGIGLGGGIALAADYFDTSFRDPSELENFLGIPVICSIPYVYVRKEKIVQNVKSALWTIVVLICTTAIGIAVVYYWNKGMIVV